MNSGGGTTDRTRAWTGVSRWVTTCGTGPETRAEVNNSPLTEYN